MQAKEFKVKGKHKDTRRLRTIEITAASDSMCKKIAYEKGLVEPYEIIKLPMKEPTKRQLEYAKDLEIVIPEDATFYDVSDLISRFVDKDNSDPNPGLIDFANSREIIFSKYIGKRALYNLVFSSLENKEKIAFFLFCIYRWVSEDREGNLDTHRYKNKIYEISNSFVNDEQFLKSMNRYKGQDIRFFGELKYEDGGCYTGGSINTIAYRKASEAICKEFNLKNKKVKVVSENTTEFMSNTFENQYNKTNKSGCLGLVLLTILFSLLIIMFLIT